MTACFANAMPRPPPNDPEQLPPREGGRASGEGGLGHRSAQLGADSTRVEQVYWQTPNVASLNAAFVTHDCEVGQSLAFTLHSLKHLRAPG